MQIDHIALRYARREIEKAMGLIKSRDNEQAVAVLAGVLAHLEASTIPNRKRRVREDGSIHN